MEADDDTVAHEIRRLIEEINAPVQLLSDSATNLLQVYGRLPQERGDMLAVVDEYLSMPPRQRKEYSLQSRLAHFSGQYGGLSDEVIKVISPVIRDNSLDFSRASDEEIQSMTAFVKSRLMP